MFGEKAAEVPFILRELMETPLTYMQIDADMLG